MPRNKSEALPTCHQAQVYADATEAWIADGAPPGPSRRDDNLNELWWAIPHVVRRTMVSAVSSQEPCGTFQERCLAYIRKTYAA